MGTIASCENEDIYAPHAADQRSMLLGWRRRLDQN